jgi:PucR C-terminal helix-turn-helix domain
MRPAQLAAMMQPELPDLAREIISEIRARIPEYARPMDGPYGHVLQVAVQRALAAFFDWVADPTAPRDRRDHLCRTLGQYEAREGRSLDSLQAAYRIGVHVSWRRVMSVGLRSGAPSAVMSWLADAGLAYMDELASLSLQGYQEAEAQSRRSQQDLRKRLLRLIVQWPPVPARAITELAEIVGWPVPEEVTLVALEPGPDCLLEPLAPPDDCLEDLGGSQPHLLLPGSVHAGRREVLAAALAGRQSAVGVSVPVAEAAHSLRWARQALSLSRAGIIDAGQVTFCEDYLVELWLLADQPLVDQLAKRRLGAVADLGPAQRRRMTETFAAWLETSGTAPAMAERLSVHPQTVRYRMRKLESALDGQLKDPDARFAIEAVLRATRLRDRAADGARPGPAADADTAGR